MGNLKYIVATGAQYINTGFVPSGKTTVDISFEPLDISGNNTIFCSRTKASNKDTTALALFTIKSTGYRYDHYGTSKMIAVDDIIAKQSIKTTATSISIGSSSASVAKSTNASPLPLYLLASNSDSTGSKFSNYAKCRLFHCKIFDDGTLVRDLRPYDNNGVVGMMDLLTNTFYASASGTQFLSPDADPGKKCNLTVHIPSSVGKGDVLNCPYSGSAKSITLPKGTYKLEVWGAEGGGRRISGNSNSGLGGYGGYSKGILTLNAHKVVYVYAGGVGASTDTTLAEGGFNGGGCAWGSSNSEPGNGGGGGSDIRIGQDSLYARIIVAGGGGGGGEDSGDSIGHGGGTSGIASGSGTAYPGTATGSTGGGAFGQGAHTPNDGGGGGGGWYGGGTTNGSQTRPTANSSNDTSGGSGGSGYVYTSSTASQYPSGCLLDSSMYLTDASTVAGNTTIVSPTGKSLTGSQGNGYCRITVIQTGYTATWVADGTTVRQDTLDEGDALSPPNVDKAGYITKWQVDGVNVDLSTYVMPAKDITLTAVYISETIHYTFYDSGVVSYGTGSYGGSIDLPTGSNGTGKFVGWWDGSNTYASTYIGYEDTMLIARYDLVGAKLTIDSVSLQPNPVQASATVLLAVTAVMVESSVPRWAGVTFSASDGLPMSSPYQVGIWDTSEGDPMAVFAGKGIKASGRDVPPLQAQTVPLPRCGIWSSGISDANGSISFQITGTVTGGPYTSTIVMLSESTVNVTSATIRYNGGTAIAGQCIGSKVVFPKGTYSTFTITITGLSMPYEHAHILNIAPGGSE